MNEPKFKWGEAVEVSIKCVIKEIKQEEDGRFSYWVDEMDPKTKYCGRSFRCNESELLPMPMPEPSSNGDEA